MRRILTYLCYLVFLLAFIIVCCKSLPGQQAGGSADAFTSKGLVLSPAATLPTTPTIGEIATQVTGGVYTPYLWNGISWQALGGGSSAFTTFAPNNGTKATELNKLACYYDPPAANFTATVCPASGTAGRYTSVIGVVVAGAGTTGNATIVTSGPAQVIFDTAPTAGDLCVPSTNHAGECTNTPLLTFQAQPLWIAVGEVQSTSATAGTYTVNVRAVGPSVIDSTKPSLMFSMPGSPFPVSGYGYIYPASAAAQFDWIGTGGFCAVAGSDYGCMRIGSSGNYLIDASGAYNSNYYMTEFNTGTQHDISDLSNVSGAYGVRASIADVYKATLTADATLANPINNGAGQSFTWLITQDGTGGRSNAYGNQYQGTPLVSGIAGDTTAALWINRDSTHNKQIAPTMPIHPTTLTAQAAAIAAVTLAKAGPQTLSRFSGILNCTTTNTGTVTLNLIWTDSGAFAHTESATADCATLGAASIARLDLMILPAAASVIQYSTTITGTVAYDVAVALESLQ